MNSPISQFSIQVKLTILSIMCTYIGVIGLGSMGHGVAQLCAQSGYNVIACETSEAALKNGLGKSMRYVLQAITMGCDCRCMRLSVQRKPRA